MDAPQKPRRIRHHVNPLCIRDVVTFDGFGNKHPIIIDIGAAEGEFSAQLMEQKPEANFLLFEIRVPLQKYLRECFKDKPNVAVLGGDAARSLPRILECLKAQGEPVQEIYINFPDPWPKARHHKRRVVTPDFLHAVQPFLTRATRCIFQTDHPRLFADTKEVLEGVPAFSCEVFDDPPYGIRTAWEQKTTKVGREIYRIRFWKR